MGRQTRRRRWPITISAGLVMALIAAACSSGTATVVAGAGALGHIHDLVLTEDGRLLAASHTGLYRIEDTDRAVLVGTEQHDLMAMTTDSDDALLAGGHPDLRLEQYAVEGRLPFLGLARSTDGGETWAVGALLGITDFHALIPFAGELYGADVSGSIWRRDAAGEWSQLGEVDARDLAINPLDADQQVAASFDAVVWSSSDGAVSWSVVEGAPALIEVEWASQGSLLGVDEAGTIYAAEQPAGPWTSVAAGLDGAETFYVDQAGRWWLTVHGAGISRSDDNGATWIDVYVPPARP
jgi:hypothetical protein